MNHLFKQISNIYPTLFLVVILFLLVRVVQQVINVEMMLYHMLLNILKRSLLDERMFLLQHFDFDLICSKMSWWKFWVQNIQKKIVACGAHLDSRNNLRDDTKAKSPGADDNGSGSVTMMEIGRILGRYNIQLEYTLRILFFAGEEQGLLGSAAYANQFKAAGDDIIAYINTDMLGYLPALKQPTLSFITRNSDPGLTSLCRSTATLYYPELPQGESTVCCSDQQSFFTNGVPAMCYFEIPGASVSYPYYHSIQDTYNNQWLSYSQLTTFGSAAFACVLELTQPW